MALSVLSGQGGTDSFGLLWNFSLFLKTREVAPLTERGRIQNLMCICVGIYNKSQLNIYMFRAIRIYKIKTLLDIRIQR